MLAYGTSSRDYLGRARAALDEDTSEGLFYASLELRCGIEARMSEYLEGWDHISKKKKQGWKVAHLAKNIEGAFRTGEKTIRCAIVDESNNNLFGVFYYTPVVASLRKAAERLGDRLHRMKRYYPPDAPYWQTFRSDLEQAYAGLCCANTGTLMGPPLMKGREIDFKAEILESETEMNQLSGKMTRGRRVAVNIEYLSTFPTTFEVGAMIWRDAANYALERPRNLPR